MAMTYKNELESLCVLSVCVCVRIFVRVCFSNMQKQMLDRTEMDPKA